MEITFLGTGAGLPSKSRNVSALAIKLLDELNEVWLFDCGEATQHQIMHTTIRPRKVRNIFITHLHGDHIFGLPGFLSSRSFQISEKEPLTIYGPKGIADFVNYSLKLSKSNLLYPLEIVELDPQGGTIDLAKGWKVKYLPLKHAILSYGFRIEEPDQTGELLMDRVKAFGVPVGPLLGKLKNGEVITLENGKELDGKDFIGPSIKGRIITVLGDTRPNPNIYQLCQDADVLVHEATHRAEEQQMAHQYFHSTSRQAAKNALDGNVESLFINHISSRYLGIDLKNLLNEAKEIFPNTSLANDFDTHVIPIKKVKEDHLE